MELIFMAIIVTSLMVLKKSIQGTKGMEDDGEELYYMDSSDEE